MRLLFVLTFLFFPLHDVGALQKATDRDVLEIAALTSKVGVVSIEIANSEEELVRAKGNRAIALTAKIARLEEKRKNVAEQAIWLTIRAYGIVNFYGNEPALPFGDSVLLSPEKGTEITWLPIFDGLGVKSAQNQFGKPAGSMNFLPKNAGYTASDGITRIFPGAFDSPVELASYIIHELRHFKQNITAGEGDKKTTAELEVEAYEEELALMNDPDNVLGYSKDIRKRQEDRLTVLLEGEDGKPGFKALAKEQRAAADKLRGGWPLPERSLVSHSEDEINRLIEQARGQIEIAQRDHDERLKRSYLELSRRSCANPGSVSQEELDALPRLHKSETVDMTLKGLLPCRERVYWQLYTGETADKIKQWSTPVRVPGNPFQPSPIGAAPLNIQTPFSANLPLLKDYAVDACATEYQVPLNTDLTQPQNAYEFQPERDSRAADEQAVGLGKCEGKLFRLLIKTIQLGQGDRITAKWVQDTAAGYRSTPAAPPVSTPPPRHENEREGRGGCWRGDDPFGCQPRK